MNEINEELDLEDLYYLKREQFYPFEISDSEREKLNCCCDDVMRETIECKYGVDVSYPYTSVGFNGRKLKFADYFEIIETIKKLNKDEDLNSLEPMKTVPKSTIETAINVLIDDKIE